MLDAIQLPTSWVYTYVGTNGTYVRGFVQIIKSFLGVGITKSAIVFGTLLLNCNYKLTSVGRQKERVTKATSKAKPKIRD